jgi:hypothetical protein
MTRKEFMKDTINIVAFVVLLALVLLFAKSAFAEWHHVSTNGAQQSCYTYPNGTVTCN